MKRFIKGAISFVIVMAMMCSMVGVLAYGTNSVNASALKVEVIDADGVSVVGSWTDPATTATGANAIWVTSAQMLKITASLTNGGDVTVFSYADGTEESALDNSNIQYVGQEESGTVIKIRPRATLTDGEYVMYVGGDDVLAPYAFKYNVGAAKNPLGVEGIVTRVPKVAATGGAAVTYKFTTALAAATDIADITVNGTSIKDSCTIAYNESAGAWELSIANAGYTYDAGTYSAVISSAGYAATTVQFTVYDSMNYVDASGNVLYTSEIIDNKATLKPDTAFNGAKVASVEHYFTSWAYNGVNYSIENGDTEIPVVDGLRTAVLNTATPQEGYDAGDIISKTGAQWVKYTVEGDETEYDGIRFVSLLDFDAKINGYTGVDYKDLSKVTEEEVANMNLTSGTGTIKWTEGSSSSKGTPNMVVDAGKNSLTVNSVGGNYNTGYVRFEPETVRTDAVKNVLTFKFKPALTDADGNPDVTANASAPAYVRFGTVGKMADGSEVIHRATQYAFSASTAGSGSFSRGAGSGANGYSEGQFTLGDDGYYYIKVVSYQDANGRQFAYSYDMNADEAAKGYHRYDSGNTYHAAELGHGFAFEFYKGGSDGSRTLSVELKDVEMQYEYGEMAEIDHVGVVVSNVAQAPTIEAGYSNTVTRTVYDAIRVRQGDTVTVMDVEAIKDAAELADASGRRFNESLDSIFYAIVKIPEGRKDDTVYATPYVEFTDGTRIYGKAVVGANGKPGVTYNELRGNDPGSDTVLAAADEILAPFNWKASWTEKLGLGSN